MRHGLMASFFPFCQGCILSFGLSTELEFLPVKIVSRLVCESWRRLGHTATAMCFVWQQIVNYNVLFHVQGSSYQGALWEPNWRTVSQSSLQCDRVRIGGFWVQGHSQYPIFGSTSDPAKSGKGLGLATSLVKENIHTKQQCVSCAAGTVSPSICWGSTQDLVSTRSIRRHCAGPTPCSEGDFFCSRQWLNLVEDAHETWLKMFGSVSVGSSCWVYCKSVARYCSQGIIVSIAVTDACFSKLET